MNPAVSDKIDMSLRFWSDTVPLGPLVQQLGLPVEHLHTIGAPKTSKRPPAKQIATRHYVSIGNLRGTRDEVQSWCRSVLAKVGTQQELVSLIRQNDIEATLWIAVFGSAPVDPPGIAPDVVRKRAIFMSVSSLKTTPVFPMATLKRPGSTPLDPPSRPQVEHARLGT